MESLLDPRTFGLLNIGLSMMKNSGPSRMPQSLGSILGDAGQDGLKAYQGAQHQQLQQQMLGLQMAAAQREATNQQQTDSAIEGLAQQFPNLAPLFRVNPQVAATRAFPEPEKPGYHRVGTSLVRTAPGQNPTSVFEEQKPPETAADANGILRYKTGPNMGQIVPGFEAAREDEFTKALKAAGVQPDSQQALAFAKQRLGKLATHAPAPVQNNFADDLGLKPKDRFDMEGKLRGDYRANPTVKAADEMDSAFRMIEAAYKSPSAANDLAMATKYMKILDPTSVVRESEFALAVNATGLFDKVQNYAASILEGKKLNPAQREDFYKSAKAITDSFAAERVKIAQQFEQNATQYKLTPNNVIGGPPVAPDSQPARPTGLPKRGDVRDGWEFIGGDPSNRMNWRKAAR